ncbi:MAG: hypothetical protein ACREAM_01050 [Blastocatellia bacterium]
MKRAIATIVFLLCSLTPCFAQQEIKVNPASVNVYSQGATTVFLTYGNLGDYRPVETAWCGEVIPASPDIGFRCAPGTIYGALPKRHDIARRSGTGGYTDIVSVPAAIARKAYQAAAAGQASEFFYVRRFVSAGGGPDQFGGLSNARTALCGRRRQYRARRHVNSDDGRRALAPISSGRSRAAAQPARGFHLDGDATSGLLPVGGGGRFRNANPVGRAALGQSELSRAVVVEG